MEQREENEACFDYPESRQRKAIANEENRRLNRSQRPPKAPLATTFKHIFS